MAKRGNLVCRKEEAGSQIKKWRGDGRQMKKCNRWTRDVRRWKGGQGRDRRSFTATRDGHRRWKEMQNTIDGRRRI